MGEKEKKITGRPFAFSPVIFTGEGTGGGVELPNAAENSTYFRMFLGH